MLQPATCQWRRALSAFQEFFDDANEGKNCTRIIQIASGWQGGIRPSPEDVPLYETMGWVECLFSLAALPGGIAKTWTHIKNPKHRSIFAAGAKFIVELSALCGHFQCLAHIYSIDCIAIRSLQQLNRTAGLVGAAVSAGMEIRKIAALQSGACSQATKTGLYLLRLAGSVACVALGALGLAGGLAVAILGVAASTQLTLALLTASLALALSAHFYERILDPKMGGGRTWQTML